MLVAHRPGFVAPTLAARQFATLDQFSRGRVAMHTISGANDDEQQRDGDFLPKADRYRRTDEYLHILRRYWTAEEPFDFDGEFYRLRQAYTPVRCFQQPHVPVYFGGSSDEALQVSARHADVYAQWGEPLAETASTSSGSAARRNRDADRGSHCRPARSWPRPTMRRWRGPTRSSTRSRSGDPAVAS